MRGFGELEAAIMERLWTRGVPMTVREILDDLTQQRSLAYTTVSTVVENLHKKQWLTRQRDGRAHRYTAVMSREQYSTRLMREALNASGNPAVTLLGLVEQMNADEAAALRAALTAGQDGSQP